MPTGRVGSALSRPGNIQPGGDLPAPSATPYGRFVAVDVNDDYWISAWSRMRRWVAGTGRLYLAEYDADGGLLALTQFAAISAVEATDTRHSLHMGPNTEFGRTAWQASTAKVKVVAQADGSPDMTWDLDAWQIERGRLLTAYAPRPQELIDYQIDVTQIADDAVTTPKLVANSVVAGKIAAGAITTEKLAADAVIANVANVGGTVVIDSTGIVVTGGDLTVTNPGGTVIIDGTSNMFKVLSTGTISIANGPNGSGGTTEIITSVTLALGLAYVPAFLGFLESAVNTAIVGNWMDWVRTTGFTDSYGVWEQMACYVNMNGTDTKPVALWRVSDLYNQSAKSAVFRYYVLKEASI